MNKQNKKTKTKQGEKKKRKETCDLQEYHLNCNNKS